MFQVCRKIKYTLSANNFSPKLFIVNSFGEIFSDFTFCALFYSKEYSQSHHEKASNIQKQAQHK